MTGRRLRLAMLVLALAGLAVAGYLTWTHYAGVPPVCTSGGCETVQTSRWSRIAGIPVALLGVAGYLAILASLALRGDGGRVAGALLTLGGLGFSAYLTYLELFEIEAICQWCVASAAIMALLACLALARLLLAGEPPEEPEPAPGDRNEPRQTALR